MASTSTINRETVSNTTPPETETQDAKDLSVMNKAVKAADKAAEGNAEFTLSIPEAVLAAWAWYSRRAGRTYAALGKLIPQSRRANGKVWSTNVDENKRLIDVNSAPRAKMWAVTGMILGHGGDVRWEDTDKYPSAAEYIIGLLTTLRTQRKQGWPAIEACITTAARTELDGTPRSAARTVKALELLGKKVTLKKETDELAALDTVFAAAATDAISAVASAVADYDPAGTPAALAKYAELRATLKAALVSLA